MAGYLHPRDTVLERLLIVEDEEILRKHLVRLFVREGFDVAAAGTCAEATRELSGARFRALILDVRLPDGDGLDLLAELGHDRWPAVTVAITAWTTPENELRAARLGVDRLLRKPIDLRQLVNVVRGGTPPGI